MDSQSTRSIPLSKGLFALVDEADYEILIRHKWYALKSRNTFYAIRNEKVDGKPRHVLMHRQLLNPTPDLQVDHINRDGLDNRRKNIRACTQSVNIHNSKLIDKNTSGYRGVIHRKGVLFDSWRAQISVNGYMARHYPPRGTPEEAARDYDAMARQYLGEDTFQNFPSTQAT